MQKHDSAAMQYQAEVEAWEESLEPGSWCFNEPCEPICIEEDPSDDGYEPPIYENRPTFKPKPYRLMPKAETEPMVKQLPAPQSTPQVFSRQSDWPVITLTVRAVLADADRLYEKAMRERDAAERLMLKKAVCDIVTTALGSFAASDVIEVMKEKRFGPSAAANVAWRRAVSTGKADGFVSEVEQVAMQKAQAEVEHESQQATIVRRYTKANGERVAYALRQTKWSETQGMQKRSGFGPKVTTKRPCDYWD